MTDIIERLRHPQGVWPDFLVDMREAADKIERLEHMQANLHGHIKRLERELSATKAERTRAQQACEQIASRLGCHAGRDGDCTWKHCPQERDGEPARTGRHCPLDVEDAGE